MGRELTYAEMAKDLDPEGPILDYLLLDIEIFDTTIEGYRAFLQAMLDAPYTAVELTNTEDRPPLDVAEAIRRIEDPDAGMTIEIDIGPTRIRGHLHSADYIDMDCPPQDINASSFGDLCAFMRRAGRATGRNVYATAERRPEQAFFAYLVDDDGFVRIRRPETMTPLASELAGELRSILRPLRSGKGPWQPELAAAIDAKLEACVPPLNDLRWHTELTRQQADNLLALQSDMWRLGSPDRTAAFHLPTSVTYVRRAFGLNGRSTGADRWLDQADRNA
ncbi:MAG: hypothetical protein NCW75_02265 [Phycisphaera sp.]|nr:MAG: hypothetical protein NCW75_02265 [Phycisphaera sp.]